MRRFVALLFSLGAVVLTLVVSFPLAGTASASTRAVTAGFVAADGAERISAYRAAYELQVDGSVRVTETITQVFPSGAERHGITRDIRVRAGYRDREDVYRFYRLSALAVSSPTGAPADVSEDDLGAYKHLRIGSPDETVEGTQTYVIAYTLANVVNGIDSEHAEFVHDPVGVANEQTYGAIEATVTAPAAATQAACTHGRPGEDSLCDSHLGDSTDGDPTVFTLDGLDAGEGMTIAVELPRDAFGDLAPELIEGSTDGEDGGSTVSPVVAHRLGQLSAGLGLFLPLLATAAMSALVWTRGRDELYAGLTPGLAPGAGDDVHTVRRGRSGTVAVQFNPPPGMQPGMVGTLIDEAADTVDVTATLIDLAVRGHLTITETDRGAFHRTDWLLTAQTPPANSRSLSAYEELLLDGIFSRGNEVRLSDLKNSFASTLTAVKGEMYNEVVRRGWFRRSPQSQRNAWVGLGMALVALGVVAAFFLGGVIGTSSPVAAVPIGGATILGIGLVLSGLVVRTLGKRMASRTADGSAMLAQSLGFRQYLVTAEANQIKFEEAQQIFSAFLPFAIVFGVAEQWADTFERVAAAAAAAGQHLSGPTWYVGTDSWGGGGFGEVAEAADAFSTQAAGTFVSTAGSSGSSVFSGGGGISVGGGGSGSSGGTW